MLSANPLILLAYSPILDALFKFSDLAESHSIFLFKTPIYLKTKKITPGSVGSHIKEKFPFCINIFRYIHFKDAYTTK